MKSVAQTVIEADRFYTIAAHTGNVIQAVEGSKDGGTVRLGKYDHKPEQEWSFVREGDGVYRIRNRASGKLLDLTMTGTANGTYGFWGLVILVAWQQIGYMMIIYIAGLQAVPEDMLEAAKIDGANKWQTLWKVTIPNVKIGRAHV